MNYLKNLIPSLFLLALFIPAQGQNSQLIADNCCNDEHKIETIYSSTGELIETRLFLDKKETPSAVKWGFNQSFYNDWKIDKIIRVTTLNESFYRMLISKQNNKFQLAFDKNGFLIKDPVLEI